MYEAVDRLCNIVSMQAELIRAQAGIISQLDATAEFGALAELQCMIDAENDFEKG